jgi:MOSC domain-containing protein YiiM
VSLLAWESVQQQLEQLRKAGVQCPKAKELTAASAAQPTSDVDLYEIHPGDYAENLTVKGVDLRAVRPGDTIHVGTDAVLEVTTIGKECHYHCAVYKRLGDCVMPREGVFTKVVQGGRVASGDEVRVEKMR